LEGEGRGKATVAPDMDGSPKEHKNEYCERKIKFFSALKKIEIIEPNKRKLNIQLQ
jgi:hypothetical protein